MKCTNCGFVTNCNFCPMCGTKLITEEIDNNGTSGSVLDDINEFSKINSNEIGIFEAKKRAARGGINPRTKERIVVPESISPTFKAGKTLKQALTK